MAIGKLKLRLEYLGLEDAAELAECKVSHLIDIAADGDLPLYVLAHEWRAGNIQGIDESIDLVTAGGAYRYLGPDLPREPSVEDDDFDNKYQEWERLSRTRDRAVSNHVEFVPGGRLRALYLTPLSGPQLLTKACIGHFRNGAEGTLVELDVTSFLTQPNSIRDLTYRPDPEVLFKDALDQRKIRVKATDFFHLVSGEVTDPENEKTQGGVSRKTLLKLVIGMATGGNYKYDPNATRNEGVGAIETRLQSAGVPLDQDSIRKALREAAVLLTVSK